MTPFYRSAQFLSYAYYRLFHGFAAEGLENIPKDGPFLLASNHLSFLDPPALGCLMPRNLHYFARDSLFKGPLGMLIRALNSIPVNRSQLDLATLRTVLKVLKDGHPLLVFPEGTRSEDGSLGEGKKSGYARGQISGSGFARAYFRIIRNLGQGQIFTQNRSEASCPIWDLVEL